jgi:hypothetical protein
LRKYGIASEIGCLTISEAAKLNRMVNGRAKRPSSSVIERFSSLRQEHSAVPEMAEEFPETEKREQIGFVPPENNRCFEKIVIHRSARKGQGCLFEGLYPMSFHRMVFL